MVRSRRPRSGSSTWRRKLRRVADSSRGVRLLLQHLPATAHRRPPRRRNLCSLCRLHRLRLHRRLLRAGEHSRLPLLQRLLLLLLLHGVRLLLAPGGPDCNRRSLL